MYFEDPLIPSQTKSPVDHLKSKMLEVLKGINQKLQNNKNLNDDQETGLKELRSAITKAFRKLKNMNTDDFFKFQSQLASLNTTVAEIEEALGNQTLLINLTQRVNQLESSLRELENSE